MDRKLGAGGFGEVHRGYKGRALGTSFLFSFFFSFLFSSLFERDFVLFLYFGIVNLLENDKKTAYAIKILFAFDQSLILETAINKVLNENKNIVKIYESFIDPAGIYYKLSNDVSSYI
jgi:hypothetical protein